MKALRESMTVCVAALLVATLVHAEPKGDIRVGDSRQYELAGRNPHRFDLAADDWVRVSIANVSRGTILTVYDQSSQALLRAATWRGGPEGVYHATFPVSGSVVLEISPDQEIAPAGDYRIRIDASSEADADFTGERAMTEGADLHLQYYFGEGDHRQAALDAYLAAAQAFESSGYVSRHADAVYEAGVVCDEIGLTGQALQHFESAAELWQGLNDVRGIAATENFRGLVYWTLGDTNQALSLFESALATRTRLGDTYFYAQTTDNIGLIHRDLGDVPVAIAYSEHALGAWQGDTDLMSLDPQTADFAEGSAAPWLLQGLYALNNLGWAYEAIDDLDQADAHYSKALALSRFLERNESAAELQNNLGRIRYRSGKLEESMRYLEDSLHYFSNVEKDEAWAASAHHNLALVFRAAGDTVRARIELEAALRLRTEERHPVGRAETLQSLAELDLASNQVDSATTRIIDALGILAAGKVRRTTEANILIVAGRVYLAGDKPAIAEAHLSRAFDLHRATDSVHGATDARLYRAIAYHAQGRSEAAIIQMQTALASSRDSKYRMGEFRTLTAISRVHLDSGSPEPALLHAREALAISEEVRRALRDPALLRDFATVQRDAYNVVVAAQLQLGQIELAWQAADAARARRFLDLLGQSGFDIESLEPDDRLRFRELIRKRDELASNNLNYDANAEYAETAASIRERAAIIQEIDRLQSRARLSIDNVPARVSLDGLQAMLSDSDLVLEFFIGQSHAGAWAITTDSIVYRDLSLLVRSEATASEGIAAIRAHSSPDSSALERLSRLLLDDFAIDLAEADRLIVVPDGVIHYIPYSALLDPSANYEAPLIAGKEVSYLPSAATLGEIVARTNRSNDGVVVFADPIFDHNDQRVRRQSNDEHRETVAAVNPFLTRAQAAGPAGVFPRLPGTREEAAAIEAVSGDTNVVTLLDADASRERVMSGQLADFRIIHFATHGVLDIDEPALSGLVLSGNAADGTATPGFLRSQDVATLNLAADLVVLSGCETGLGQIVHGEGLVGLSRSFLHAGADQVVSSLWQVPDRATAALMRHFYRGMLQEGMPPSAALRSAKLKIRENAAWQHPFFWAAFILQGDWR